VNHESGWASTIGRALRSDWLPVVSNWGRMGELRREQVQSLLALPFVLWFTALGVAHVADGRWAYLPSALMSALLALTNGYVAASLEGVRRAAWRFSERYANSQGLIMSCAARTSLSAPPPDFASRAVQSATLIVCVSQFGSTFHSTHGGATVVVLSGVLALGCFFFGLAWSALRMRDAQAERRASLYGLVVHSFPSGDGRIECTFVGDALDPERRLQAWIEGAKRGSMLLPLSMVSQTVDDDWNFRCVLRSSIIYTPAEKTSDEPTVWLAVTLVPGEPLRFELPITLRALKIER
jgi:hypothetical protein